MTPRELSTGSFASYPREAQALAAAHLPLLRAMPLALLPGYLAQIQSFDTLFPIEQERLRLQLDALGAKPEWMDAFRAVTLPPALERMDWARRPGEFEGALAGALWQAGEIDAYHRAAEALFAALPQPSRAQSSAAPLLIAVFGRGARPAAYPLFMRLRASGLYARRVDEADLEAIVMRLLTARAKGSDRYRHWYVDGGEPWAAPELAQSTVEQFSFPRLAPVTGNVLREMDAAVREGTGPETLANRLRALPPAALGIGAVTSDPRMAHFFISLLTQGSGTQLYSTSFVQAAAVELVRRAQPETLLLRFAPRRKPASMNDMLEQRGQSVEFDAQGALIDADMALYYAFLAMQRQPGGEQAQLLALAEGHGEAFLAGPAVTRGVESETPLSVAAAWALLRG